MARKSRRTSALPRALVALVAVAALLFLGGEAWVLARSGLRPGDAWPAGGCATARGSCRSSRARSAPGSTRWACPPTACEESELPRDGGPQRWRVELPPGARSCRRTTRSSHRIEELGGVVLDGRETAGPARHDAADAAPRPAAARAGRAAAGHGAPEPAGPGRAAGAAAGARALRLRRRRRAGAARPSSCRCRSRWRSCRARRRAPRCSAPRTSATARSCSTSRSSRSTTRRWIPGRARCWSRSSPTAPPARCGAGSTSPARSWAWRTTWARSPRRT